MCLTMVLRSPLGKKFPPPFDDDLLGILRFMIPRRAETIRTVPWFALFSL